MSSRVSGKVQWFDAQKGYGFITPDDGGEQVFVHQSSIRTEGFRSLGEGESVEYVIESDPQGRSKAADVTGPDESQVQGSRRGSGPDGGGRGGRGGYGGGRGGYGGGGGYGGSGGSGCFTCGETGHMARDCSQGGGGRYGGGGGGGQCYTCGGSGHFARECTGNSR